MTMQEWAIRNSRREWQRKTGAISMLKGETERARCLSSRVLVARAWHKSA